MSTAPRPQQVNQDALIKRAQQGDSAAFAELYALHKRRAFSICYRMVKNQADAEDLVQEAFLQLFRKLKLFRGESQFATWFHRLVVNVALMKLRKKDGRYDSSLDELVEVGDSELKQEVTSVDHHLELSPERIAVGRAIEQLPPGYRLILRMHDLEGFEHNEIAEILGCSIGNSKSQLNKARKALLSLLGIKLDPLAILVNFDRFLSDVGNEGIQ
jgi:RNA polymerase sigma-70 factor (ECF subfamily)